MEERWNRKQTNQKDRQNEAARRRKRRRRRRRRRRKRGIRVVAEQLTRLKHRREGQDIEPHPSHPSAEITTVPNGVYQNQNIYQCSGQPKCFSGAATAGARQWAPGRRAHKAEPPMKMDRNKEEAGIQMRASLFDSQVLIIDWLHTHTHTHTFIFKYISFMCNCTHTHTHTHTYINIYIYINDN